MVWRALWLGTVMGVGGCGLVLDLDPPEPSTEDGSGVPCTTASECPVDACSGPATCVSGLCRYRERVQCDDGVGCTADRCDPAVGCTHLPRDGQCDDGVACTRDLCHLERGCLHVPEDAACADDHRCTRDLCTARGCLHQPDDTLCGLATCDPLSGCVGTECTNAEHCRAAPCEAEVRCEEGRCVAVSAPDGTPCDDGDQCTASSVCRAGACVGVTFVDECAACATCDRETGGGCEVPVAAPDGTACDDGDACTGPGTCLGGACSAGSPRICASSPCLRAVGCDARGGCLYEPLAAGDACPASDLCSVGRCDGAGTCLSEPRDCGPRSTCEPATGTCVCLDTSARLCGGRCCAGSCAAGVCTAGDAGVPLDGSVRDAGPRDASPDAPAEGGAGCGILGAPCTGADVCSGGYTCDAATGRCVPGSDRPTCGGFAGAACETALYPRCRFFLGADYGPCLTEAEDACACTAGAGLFVCD